VGGRLAHFLNQWQLITSNKWVLSVLRGASEKSENLSAVKIDELVLTIPEQNCSPEIVELQFFPLGEN
jgi:hypothetical protein